MATGSPFEDRFRVAQQLRKLRLRCGMTQAALSERVGFAHPCSISSIESARRPIYTHELCTFARALGCDVDDILGEPEHRSPSYPLRKRARLPVVVAAICVLQMIAGGARADDHPPQPPAQIADGPAADTQSVPAGDGPSGGGATDRLIWGDNCDPTLPMAGVHLGS